jgi:hypothetical protein
MYRTPSDYAPTPPEAGGSAATTPPSADQMSLEFNNSVERVFGETDSGGPRALASSSPEHSPEPQ